MENLTHESRILRDAEVRRRTGLSRTQRWRKVRDGSFPPPIQVSANRVGWMEADITNWLNARPVVNWAPKPDPSGAR